MSNHQRSSITQQQQNSRPSNPDHSFTSSEDDDSQSISIEIKTKLNEIKERSSIHRFEQEITALQMANQDLREQNQQLVKELKKVNRRFQNLEESLKEKEKNIHILNRQISQSQDQQSNFERLINMDGVHHKKKKFEIIQQKGKMNRKSKRKPIENQSQESSKSEEEESSSSDIRLNTYNLQNIASNFKQENIELQKQAQAWKQQLFQYQREMKWRNSLVQKMNGMAKQISLIFSDKIYNQKWDLKKKSKSSWRYLKYILKYIFSCTE